MTSPLATSGTALSLILLAAGCCESRLHVADVYGRRCYVFGPAAPSEEPCSTNLAPVAPAPPSGPATPAVAPDNYYPAPGRSPQTAPAPPAEPRAQDRSAPPATRTGQGGDAPRVGRAPTRSRRLSLPQLNPRVALKDLFGRVRNRAVEAPATSIPVDAPVAAISDGTQGVSRSPTQLVGYESHPPVTLGTPEFEDAGHLPTRGFGHSVAPRR